MANTNYRDLLKAELAKRTKRDSNYSMRAFARDLKLSPSRVSEILRHKQGLSRASAEKVAKNLEFTEEKKKEFMALVQLSDARSKYERAEAAETLAQTTKNPIKEMDLLAFEVISDDLHFAILELTKLKTFKSDTTWMAKTLEAPKEEVERAIKRLLTLDLIEKRSDGKLAQTRKNLTVRSSIPMQSIRDFHTQVLNKAKAAIAKQPVEQRELSALMIAVSSVQLEAIKAEIRSFRKKINQLVESDKGAKDRVYCMSTQLFALTKNEDAGE